MGVHLQCWHINKEKTLKGLYKYFSFNMETSRSQQQFESVVAWTIKPAYLRKNLLKNWFFFWRWIEYKCEGKLCNICLLLKHPKHLVLSPATVIDWGHSSHRASKLRMVKWVWTLPRTVAINWDGGIQCTRKYCLTQRKMLPMFLC